MVGMRGSLASVTLVSWADAWLTGHVGLDEAADAAEHTGGPHVVVGIPGEPAEVPLRRALAALRGAGLSALRLSLPAPGDPLGLSGPPEFNTCAIEAGEAALVELDGTCVGLVPAEDRRGSSYVGTRWTAHETRAAHADVPSLADADHDLTLAVRDATEELLTVDPASWGPEISDALNALRESHRHEQVGGLAPGYPARAHRVAALAGRLAVVVDLARTTENAALTATQIQRRTDALRTLDRAVRRARVAACNSVLDPVR